MQSEASHFARYQRQDYLPSGRFPVRVIWYKDHGMSTIHDHEFMEIVLILTGSGIHYSANGRWKIEQGDILVVQPQAWHQYVDCRGLEVANILLGLELFHRDVPLLSNDRDIMSVLSSGKGGDEAGHRILRARPTPDEFDSCVVSARAMTDSLDSNRPCSQPECLAHLILMLTNIARAAKRNQDDNKTRVTDFPPTIAECVRILTASPFEPWTIAELAERVHYNPHYLMRIFKQCLGVSIFDYLSRLRAERAALLLRETSLGINEIGAGVGWSNPTYFARRFKAHFGITATRYREMCSDGLWDLAPRRP